MLLFVGLGNPGREHARQRHNIGFMALDRIADDHGFGPWRDKFQGQVSEGRLGDEKVILLKPSTYMNLSGQSVGAAMRFHKIPVEDLTVLHDELDLAPGKCRAKRGGGHAGHNGLRSIHQHCGPDYGRVRLGIGHPGRKELVSGYVLHDFSKYDEQWLDDLLRGVSDGARALAAKDDVGFMNAVALRTTPQRPKPPRKPAPGKTPAPRPEGPMETRLSADPARPSSSAPAPAPAPEAEAETLSPLEKLKRRFS
ncbi:MAG: aminoacyl-tRNA hydrolase [Rhodobacteraceae bacterium]|nr:aminoacyl-tRNA hydrolase [Paracoccaceae bacterium]